MWKLGHCAMFSKPALKISLLGIVHFFSTCQGRMEVVTIIQNSKFRGGHQLIQPPAQEFIHNDLWRSGVLLFSFSLSLSSLVAITAADLNC